MDNYTDILEIEPGELSSVDIRVGAEQSSLLTVSDLSLLQLEDLEQVREIIELYAEMDLPRENVELFKQHLLQRVDSWFVQVDEVGLIYLTNIVPSFTANLQVIFWDKKFGKNRRELVQAVLATGVEEFALTRISAFVPETNGALQIELKKIGFHHEGTLRKAWREAQDCDLLVFGLLSEEVIWPTVPQLKTISSAQVT